MAAAPGHRSVPAAADRPGVTRPARRRLAEALDLIAVALVLIAYAVAATGGFRWEPFGFRLSMSSPSRAVLVAGLLLVLRRWRAPGAPLHPWLGRVVSLVKAGLTSGSAEEGAGEDAAPHDRPAACSAAAAGPRVSSRPTEWAVVGLLFLGLTALMTWPQVAALHSVPDLGDPLFSVWRLSWVAHQLPRAPLHLFDGNMFFPELRTLAYSDAMLATSLIAAPFLWLGVHQVVVYNGIFLLSFAASGVAMYALARELTGDRAAAVVAGVAFAFYPFRFEHYSHLELQVTFWTPLALLMLHRTVRSGRVRDGAVTGLLVALQMLSSLYAGLFLLVVMGVVWSCLALQSPRTRRIIRPWLAAAAVVVMMVLPIAVPYLQNRGQLGERSDWETRLYSATPGNYLVAHARSRLYANVLDGPRMPELSLFPGIGIVALALAGAWPRVTPTRIAYLAAAIIAFDGSLGSNGIVFPTLRDYLLPFRGLRVPARFSMLVGLALSVLAAYGIQRLRRSRVVPRTVAMLLPVAIVAMLLFENLPNLVLIDVPDRPPRIYDYFTGASPSVLVDLPFPASLMEATRDARPLYYASFHWQTLVAGSSGYFPESFRQAVKMMRGFPTARGVAFLQERGVEFLAIDSVSCAEGDYVKTTEFLDQEPRVELVRRISGSGQRASLYRVHAK
jgi:hypothetical protein